MCAMYFTLDENKRRSEFSLYVRVRASVALPAVSLVLTALGSAPSVSYAHRSEVEGSFRLHQETWPLLPQPNLDCCVTASPDGSPQQRTACMPVAVWREACDLIRRPVLKSPRSAA